MLRLSLQDDVALRAEVLWYVGCRVDGDAGHSMLVGLFSPVCRLRPSVPWDVLVLVFRWGRSKGEKLYPVQGDGVPWSCWAGCICQVHVACYGGGRERLTQGRRARGGAGRVVELISGVADAVWGDVYGEGSNGAL